MSLFTVHQRSKRDVKSSGLEMLNQADYQLDRLRNMPAGGATGGVAEYNPNYDFGGPKCSIQDLPKIDRTYLRLVRL